MSKSGAARRSGSRLKAHGQSVCFGWKADIVALAFVGHQSCVRTRRFFVASALALVLANCSKPPQTYSAACSIPLSNWKTEKDGIGHLLPVMPVYVGSDGTVLWTKDTISDEQLRTNMLEVSKLNPVPQIVLEISPSASCGRVRAIRAIMDAAPVCKGPLRRCSEGWNWREWPTTGGP